MSQRLHLTWLFGGLAISGGAQLSAAPVPAGWMPLIENRCAGCHDDETKEGGLNLTALMFEPADPKNFAAWVKVHDRVTNGEMPPKKKDRPPKSELEAFTESLASALTAAEDRRVAQEGRATQRRLNRHEYENALRDLLQAPWLQVKDSLPEDGEAHRFNKSGEALDISHVLMARYLAAADTALREVMATQAARPATRTTRYYAREQDSFIWPMKTAYSGNKPERGTFPLLGLKAQPDVRAEKAPMTVGAVDPATRDLEAMGVIAGSYEPLTPTFEQFKAPASGRYKLRVCAFTVWVAPGGPMPGRPEEILVADFDDVSPGRRREPIVLYSETPPQQGRRLGAFDVGPEPGMYEIDTWLLEGETIRPDAARLFRSRPGTRPGAGRRRNPLAEKDGQSGVAFRWLEVEGPIYDAWPTAGQRLLFDELPVRAGLNAGAPVDVISADPGADAARLLKRFTARAYRRPVAEAETQRFLPVIAAALKAGSGFAEAMIVGYTAVLCSPAFLCLEEKPGALDDYALASRLAFFLWNSPPDDELRALAAQGKLRQPEVLRAQTDRLLGDSKARRFVNAFLDYWLDLRRIVATAPDSTLYPDYYLDDLLAESAVEETQLYFAELLRGDLPARNVVASDFAILNDKLAAHYGLPPVEGVALRRVALPAGSVRGGLMTQASVLKVTANGTTTSPVLRGAWIMERILGQPPPPPPPSVPAIEPDTRGAVNIRQQLDQHRAQESCAVCHTKIDPAGFALESFDVMGGWRSRYRALAGGEPVPGIGRGGHRFEFQLALPVDSTGELPDGRKFAEVRDLKRLLLADEKQIARNVARQLAIYATGAPVRFGDRAPVEQILDRAAASHYGVRTLVHELVQSELFRNK